MPLSPSRKARIVRGEQRVQANAAAVSMANVVPPVPVQEQPAAPRSRLASIRAAIAAVCYAPVRLAAYLWSFVPSRSRPSTPSINTNIVVGETVIDVGPTRETLPAISKYRFTSLFDCFRSRPATEEVTAATEEVTAATEAISAAEARWTGRTRSLSN